MLLCSDLAIRSGTAATITPNHYDPARREFTFTTKYQERQRLPATQALHELMLLATDATRPIVAQLPRGHVIGGPLDGLALRATGHMCPAALGNAFRLLKKRLGITRKLTPHDFRRTTATRVYDQTKDLRLVQALLGHSALTSTLWYLDHHLSQVSVEFLETAKLNPETVQ